MNKVIKLSKNPQFYLFSVLFFLVLAFLLFYPAKYTTIDESNYIGNSYRLIDGSLRQVCNPNIPGLFEVKDYCIYKYNIGYSIILVPFVLINEKLVFLASFLSLILSTIIFYKILGILKIDQRLIFLFTFYPSFIYISRTALSESFSMLLILLSTYLLLKFEDNNKKKYLIAIGASIGAAVLIRYTNIIPLGILLLSSFIKNLKPKTSNLKLIAQNALRIMLGSLPFALFFLFINIHLYGSPFRSGYYYSKEEVFGFSYFLKHIGQYILALSVIYPLMLPVGLINRRFIRFNLAFLSVMFLYAFSVNTLFKREIQDLIFALRFLIPVLPLLMISYLDFIDKKLLKFKIANFLILPIFIISISGLFIFSFVHQHFLQENETFWPDIRLIIREE
jgi:hypothetical protein